MVKKEVRTKLTNLLNPIVRTILDGNMMFKYFDDVFFQSATWDNLPFGWKSQMICQRRSQVVQLGSHREKRIGEDR